MSSNSLTEFEIFRQNTSEALTVFLKDARTGQMVDVAAPSNFSLIDINDNDNVVVSDVFSSSGGTYVTRAGPGIYQFPFNTATYTGEYLAVFSCILTGDKQDRNIYVKSVPAKQFAYAAQLRNIVDKARKSIIDYIANMDRPTEPPIELQYGYKDGMLIYYLERGLQFINVVSPVTQLDLNIFPFAAYGSILLDAATIAALEAQGIFAIDTDFDYSLGGNSLVIDHFTKLSQFVSELLSRFKEQVSAFKKNYMVKGLVLYQFMPGGIRDLRYLSTMPSGFWSRLFSTSFGGG